MEETLSEVTPQPHIIKNYKTLTPKIYREATSLAKTMKELRVIHINSTALGAGGVAEILKSQVPLERSLGIKSRWFTLGASMPFFEVTKQIHNNLQGNLTSRLEADEKTLFLKTIQRIAKNSETLIKRAKPDIIILHDPQPLPLVEYIDKNIPTILRLHIDLSTPNESTLNFLKPFIEKCSVVIITSPQYRPPWLSKRKVKISMPAINPFSEKNSKISHAKEMLALLNINTNEPLISQTSRFDQWKDPLGVIQSYYIAKNKIPDLQLIMVGSFPPDNSGSKMLTKRIKKHAAGDPDIFLFTQHDDALVNAIQTASDVVMQKSIREGFGLTVTEAMWKGRAVIGGKTTGIALQIKNGKNGFTVSSPKEAAITLVRLLQNPSLRENIGRAAHKTVRDNFLLSRLVLDHLKIYRTVHKTKRLIKK